MIFRTAESLKRWKSKVYDHYQVSLIRHTHEDGRPNYLEFCFTCIVDPHGHRSQTRKRMRTAHGTKNLARGIDQCNERWGVTSGDPGDPSTVGEQQTTESVSEYTPARHRAIIAMRYSVSKRPYDMVRDPLYVDEIQLLRPGTVIPSPATVSRDVNQIYKVGSKHVKEYFSKHEGSIHLVVDGWTAPSACSHLGIVMVWFAESQMWRTALDFIQISQRHTGKNLAEVTADCLRRFDLEKKLHSITMDNATSCDVLANELAILIPEFRGNASRTRCFAHTVNLIAKALISFFLCQPKRKKAGKVSEHVTRHSKSPQSAPQPEVEEAAVELGGGNYDLTPFEQEMLDGEQPLESDKDGDGVEIDEAKEVYDREVVTSVHIRAIEVMKNVGVRITPDEEKTALGLFPKVAGLARRLHGNPSLQAEFEQIVNSLGLGGSDKTHLDHRVPTRWNSDFACLKAHFYFKDAIQILTQQEELELEAYALTQSQWRLAEHLVSLLELFDDLILRFSQAEVPMVYEVIPMLEQLKRSMARVRDAAQEPSIIRIAAEAVLLMIGKYYALTDGNEVYQIAVAMCPEKKLAWFDKNPDWRLEDRAEARRIVQTRWEESYSSIPQPTVGLTCRDEDGQPKQKRSKWALPEDDDDERPSVVLDSIETYLDSPPIKKSEVKAAGGVLKYWENCRATRPRLARMALDYLSAPASSVDAERAFSGGPFQVNHLQQQMGSESFKAQVAVRSWYNTPLLPGASFAAAIIENRLSTG